MAKQFRSGTGEVVKVPANLKEAFRVLVRQIDDDMNPEEALYWLIWMMEMRGSPPDWPSLCVRDNLLKKDNFYMRIGNYGVQIDGSRETGEGYAALKMTNGKCPFKITLQNHSNRKAEVRLEIHGIDQGTWIMMPYQTATLERPAHIAEKFCAYAVGSEGGNAIGLQQGDPKNGLVQVKFAPEKKHAPVYREPMIYDSYSEGVTKGLTYGGGHEVKTRSFSAAGVGTEGHSSQTFGTTSGFETDESESVTISLRIVEDTEVTVPRPLSSASANPIPRPL